MNDLSHQIISQTILDRLKGISTPTVSTLLLKKGIRTHAIQGVYPLNKRPIKLVAQAFTLRYIPAREDLDVVEAFRNPQHPQRVAIETVPPGFVLVMDCRGDSSAASAGSILVTRLQMRGCAGLVTDGGLRDSETIAELNMPVFCANPSAPTNLTKHHATDLNLPIGCGQTSVFPGDIVFGDGDGVIVIPLHLVEEISEEAQAMEQFEEYVMQEVKQGKPVIGLYPPNEATQKHYEAWKRGNENHRS